MCSADLIVVTASIVVLGVGSNGQVFATSAIRYHAATPIWKQEGEQALAQDNCSFMAYNIKIDKALFSLVVQYTAQLEVHFPLVTTYGSYKTHCKNSQNV